jgi:triacylglycerol lipase
MIQGPSRRGIVRDWGRAGKGCEIRAIRGTVFAVEEGMLFFIGGMIGREGHRRQDDRCQSASGTRPAELKAVRCARLDAPIVLAHGFLGIARIGLGPLTLASYFRGIPDFLRSAGNEVLVTQVHPTAGVERRARVLGDLIDAAFPDRPVHLVGHSLGGLDCRHLLADPDWSNRVLSLTTIGTPHLGSAVADAALVRLKGVTRLLDGLGIDHKGLIDLTREVANNWHRATPAPRGVACFSVAGAPALEDVCWPLRRFHHMMERWEGPNDGLVSVTSAQAFGTPLTPWGADHFQMTNNWVPAKHRRTIFPVIRAGFADVVGNLARLGFGEEKAAEDQEKKAG